MQNGLFSWREGMDIREAEQLGTMAQMGAISMLSMLQKRWSECAGGHTDATLTSHRRPLTVQWKGRGFTRTFT